MSNTSIKPISSVRPTESNTLSKMLTSIQAETVVQPRSSSARQEKPEIEPKNESMKIGDLANISIHFQVDDKTNDVTIFLVDRKSKKVLRSIPAGELQKLQIGDLVKLTV